MGLIACTCTPTKFIGVQGWWVQLPVPVPLPGLLVFKADGSDLWLSLSVPLPGVLVFKADGSELWLSVSVPLPGTVYWCLRLIGMIACTCTPT